MCYRFKPDVVWSWGDDETVLALVASLFCSFKLVNGSIRYGVRKNYRYRKMLLKFSPRIVANSTAGASLYGLPARILYNGIDMPENLPQRSTSDRMRFISVANFMPYKDYGPILRVLGKLKKNGLQFSYQILGDGPLRNEIEAEITNNNLEDVVHLRGSVSNVSDYLRNSDIFLHSSKAEGCSNAIIEAMAAGLPIISSNVGGVPETVTSENAILYTYQDESELSEAISMIINDDKRLLSMGKRSYEVAKGKFSIAAMIENYKILLMDVINDSWEPNIY